MTLGEIEKEENKRDEITEEQLMEELAPIDGRFVTYYRTMNCKLHSNGNLKDFLLWYKDAINNESIRKQVIHNTGVL